MFAILTIYAFVVYQTFERKKLIFTHRSKHDVSKSIYEVAYLFIDLNVM